MTELQWIEAEERRMRALLDEAIRAFNLQELEAVPLAEALGALEGWGWRRDEPELRLNVYLCRDWDKAQQIGERLMEMLNGDPYVVRVVTNGALLLAGVVKLPEDEDLHAVAVAIVERIASDFAGME